jgi:hypothetical protein
MDKRRFFSKFYFVLLICLLILPCSKYADGARWVFYGASQVEINYYDADSVTPLPNNIIRVWVKHIPQDAAIPLKLPNAFLFNIPENCPHSIALYEINCTNSTFDVLALTEYNDKGEVTYSEASPIGYTNIAPDSVGNSLKKIVCQIKD